MSTATVFADPLHFSRDLDENTIIADYWLEFVSVRQHELKPDESSLPEEIKLKLDDLCRHLSAISQTRSLLAKELQLAVRSMAGASAAALPDGNGPVRTVDGPFNAPSSTIVEACKLPVRSKIWESVRGSFLYATIQKCF